MGQGLSGEEIERAGGRVVEQRVEDGQVVGQRLAGGGGGGEQDVLPRQRRLNRLSLMSVGLLDAPLAGSGD